MNPADQMEAWLARDRAPPHRAGGAPQPPGTSGRGGRAGRAGRRPRSPLKRGAAPSTRRDPTSHLPPHSWTWPGPPASPEVGREERRDEASPGCAAGPREDLGGDSSSCPPPGIVPERRGGKDAEDAKTATRARPRSWSGSGRVERRLRRAPSLARRETRGQLPSATGKGAGPPPSIRVGCRASGSTLPSDPAGSGTPSRRRPARPLPAIGEGAERSP